jgi:hypothetical protein
MQPRLALERRHQSECGKRQHANQDKERDHAASSGDQLSFAGCGRGWAAPLNAGTNGATRDGQRENPPLFMLRPSPGNRRSRV